MHPDLILARLLTAERQRHHETIEHSNPHRAEPGPLRTISQQLRRSLAAVLRRR